MRIIAPEDEAWAMGCKEERARDQKSRPKVTEEDTCTLMTASHIAPVKQFIVLASDSKKGGDQRKDGSEHQGDCEGGGRQRE